MFRWVALIAALMVGGAACGGGSEGVSTGVLGPGGSGGAVAGEGGAGGSGGSGGEGGRAAREVRRLTPRLAGIIDAEAAAEVRGVLFLEETAALTLPMERFYELFPDDFDFLFFLTEAEGSHAMGLHIPMNRPAIPGTGIDHAYFDPRSPSSSIRSAIAMQLGPRGPTLHEIAHHWAVHLSSELGFSGSHWDYAGVGGQLGGFYPESLVCQTPEGASPPCEPDPDGATSYLIRDFAMVPNGRDDGPYAPLELYLMGLMPAEEVPPVPILRDVIHDEVIEDRHRFVRAHELRTVTIEEIIDFHGPRQLASEAERAFRAAFVLVTAEELTAEEIALADNWAGIFGCHIPDRWLICFEDATFGLATMNINLPEAR